MKKIRFLKYHALGNDFIVLDLIGRRTAALDFEKLAPAICHRRTGIGGDGILVLMSSRRADLRLELYNADGSWAEKSGNGLRIAAACYHRYHKKNRRIEIETEVATESARIISGRSGNYRIRVSLGQPEFQTNKIPMRSKQKYHINAPVKIDGVEIVLTALSVGNPHAVIYVDSFDFDWPFLGEVIEHSRIFPRRTNVEFAKIKSRSEIVLNDWERGAGATGSSGTGAAAAVAAGVVNGYVNRRVRVQFPLGELVIDWSDDDNRLYLTGPVEEIADGEYRIAD